MNIKVKSIGLQQKKAAFCAGKAWRKTQDGGNPSQQGPIWLFDDMAHPPTKGDLLWPWVLFQNSCAEHAPTLKTQQSFTIAIGLLCCIYSKWVLFDRCSNLSEGYSGGTPGYTTASEVMVKLF